MKVRVTTAGRLHLGFMDLNGDLGRLYGSIGVYLKSPQTQLHIEDHNELLIIEKDDNLKKRISVFIKTFAGHLGIKPKVNISVTKRIPEHKGLGSGTQLGLSLGTALAKIYNIDEKTYNIADIAGRGLRSGIGITAFERGGLIIDGGKKRIISGKISPEPPRAIMRYSFPSEWYFVLVIPEKKVGLSGEQEKEAMDYVSPSRRISEEICRLVMMQLLPALVEKDIEKFGDAVSEIDIKTGTFFKPVQGGIYSERLSYGIIRHMLASGASGAGQSSWGPTIYGLAHRDNAVLLAERMKDFIHSKKINGEIIITQARNRGAKVEVIDDIVGVGE